MGHYVIIGGGGYLGAHVISTLQKMGCEEQIVVVDPFPRSFKTINYNMEKVIIQMKSFMDTDVLDQVLPGASAVFHLAAIGHTGLIANDEKLVHEFNVTGTKQLLEKSRQYGVARFLFASSVAVAFVGESFYDITENEKLPDPERYINHYSKSKAEAEKLVLSASSNNFKTVCLRFRAIYGPEDPNVTEKVVNLIRMGLFIGMVSVHEQESLSVASSAVNCGKAFHLADKMLKTPNGLHGRVYYITDGETIGQYHFWTPLVLALGKTPPSIFIPYKLMATLLPFYQFVCYRFLGIAPVLSQFDLSVLATDNTYSIERARKELGYEPEPSQMPKTAEYYKNLHSVMELKKSRHGFHSIVLISVLLVILTVFHLILH